jgi:NADPH:quinone reductase-like Zn-dependent oxidoreductase
VRAIVQPKYGPPESVELRDEPVPEPAAGEVLVRVSSSSVNAADCEILHGYAFVRMASPLRPASRIVGSDVAGVVEGVGPGVDELAVGDAVMGDTSGHGYSAFAEYVAAPAGAFCRVPPGLTLEEAAAVPSAAWVAIKGVRDHRELGPDSRVLVNGAGGGMGTFAVQMAAARGARVTGVDSAAKHELLHAIGADETIDYRTQDPVDLGGAYDLILDVFARRSIRDWRRILAPDGAYLMVGGSSGRILSGFLLGTLLSRNSEQKLGLLLGWPQRRRDMDDVNALIEAGSVRPVIDRRYPLEEAAAALRRVEDGQALGKVVVTIAEA